MLKSLAIYFLAYLTNLWMALNSYCLSILSNCILEPNGLQRVDGHLQPWRDCVRMRQRDRAVLGDAGHDDVPGKVTRSRATTHRLHHIQPQRPTAWPKRPGKPATGRPRVEWSFYM